MVPFPCSLANTLFGRMSTLGTFFFTGRLSRICFYRETVQRTPDTEQPTPTSWISTALEEAPLQSPVIAGSRSIETMITRFDKALPTANSEPRPGFPHIQTSLRLRERIRETQSRTTYDEKAVQHLIH